jgi:hypothetical protein
MAADRISRTRVIDGLVTPAFIQNGHYFFSVNLQVYADGMVECWELLDLALFRDKLRSGWVVPDAPPGAQVSVHGLASWIIRDPSWELDAEGLYDRVVSLVRQLNPRMENLYDCHGRTTEKVDGVDVSIFGLVRERPVRSVGEGLGASRVHGDKLSVLVHDGDYHLANLRVFADGVVEIGRLPTPETTDLDGLRAAVDAARIVGSVPPGGRVRIHGLGSFVVEQACWSSIDPREQVREALDLLARLNGRPDSLDRCRDAYDAYVKSPGEETREALRAAHEAVPEHNRIYVGDMDTEDGAVHMILAGGR